MDCWAVGSPSGRSAGDCCPPPPVGPQAQSSDVDQNGRQAGWQAGYSKIQHDRVPRSDRYVKYKPQGHVEQWGARAPRRAAGKANESAPKGTGMLGQRAERVARPICRQVPLIRKLLAATEAVLGQLIQLQSRLPTRELRVPYCVYQPTNQPTDRQPASQPANPCSEPLSSSFSGRKRDRIPIENVNRDLGSDAEIPDAAHSPSGATNESAKAEAEINSN